MQLKLNNRIDSRTKVGFVTTLGAFLFWGVAVMYWKLLKQVPSLELLSHRVVWSLVFVVIILSLNHGWNEFRSQLSSSRKRIALVFSAVFLCFNWLTFVWAVNAGYIVECSLGYFINPLFNVILGYIFFRERLRPWQYVAILFALAAVLNLTFNYNRFPWIGIMLAFSFGMYGMIRKKLEIKSLSGLGAETLVLLPFALGYILYREISGAGAFLHLDWQTTVLLMIAGPVTAIPLLAFNHGVQRLRLTTVGLIQYVTPTGMFLLGVFFYHELFSLPQLISFSLIWLALVLFSLEGFLFQRGQPRRLKKSTP